MKNVVIDCDPGIDDTLALMYAIKVQMKAINMALADAGKDDTKEKSDNE